MGWKRRKLQIRVEGGNPLCGAFGAAGLLFLGVAPRGPRDAELSLTLDTSPLPITYLLFQLRRGRVQATALRSEVLFSRGSSEVIQGEGSFQLGCRKLCVEWREEASDAASRRRWLLMPVLAGMGVLAALIGWRPSIPSPSTPAPRAAGAPSSDAPSVALSEARGLMRQGRQAEARLALTAAIEEDPRDEEARRLLLTIPEEGEGEMPAMRDGAERLAMARELFEQGRESLKRGEPGSARREFERARELAGAESPAFAAELAIAAEEAEAASRRQQAPAIARVESILDSASGAPAEAAASRLVEGRKIAAALELQLPGDLRAQQLLRSVERELAAAVRRWLSLAETEERLQGCRVAAPTYRKLAAALAQADPATSALASKRAEGCRP